MQQKIRYHADFLLRTQHSAYAIIRAMEQKMLATEIKQLETRLEQKKKELAGSGVEQPEQDIFRQVVREHAGAEAMTAPSSYSSSAPLATSAIKPLTEIQKKAISVLVQHAFTHGIGSAIKEARKAGDPYLIDTLHDQLADEYYQKLVTARRISSS